MPARPIVRLLIPFLVTVFILLMEGCAASSPRFSSGEREAGSRQPKTGPRFTSKEAEEESRENDRKVERK
jgi:hypothetical protein